MIFWALPVTGSDRKPHQVTISTFVYALIKVLGKYLVWGGRDGAPKYVSMKKNSSVALILELYFAGTDTSRYCHHTKNYLPIYDKRPKKD